MEIIGIIIGLVILIFSAILHEIMHGVAAEKLGDPTARLAGRITLNPIPHIDPLMTILLPAIMLLASHGTFAFGAAKPVPVNPLFFKDGRKDMALVALAGPATNLIIALTGALLFSAINPQSNIFNLFLQITSGGFAISFSDYLFFSIVSTNIALGIFNLIPIPPLDGSKFFTIILPEEMAIKYQSLAPFGLMFLLIILFMTPAGEWINTLIVQTLRILGSL